MEQLRILRGRVDKLTLANALQEIKQRVASDTFHHIVTANTLMLLEAERDPELLNILEKASLVVPESWGIAWASRQKNEPLSEYIPGIDLMMEMCKMAGQGNYSVYLLGGKPGVAQQTGEILKLVFPGLRIAGAHHGYFQSSEEPDLIAEIRSLRPDFLFVGMSVPRQEKWISKHLSYLESRCAMGVGGSFDVISGQLKRAPNWMRQMGVEWVYRTIQEPWRLKRIKGLPVFMWRVMRELP